MATVSLCMIVRDEEAVLGRCLESAADAVDEIIIVDTGSTDRTKEIAAAFTDRIYDMPWEDDFAKARNHAFSKAEMDYQMWLDADDVLEDAAALRRLTEDLTADVVMLPYLVTFDAQGNPTMQYYRERLLKRSRHFQWVGAVHETIAPSGTVLYGAPAVLHYKEHVNDPDRNLRIFEKQLAAGKALTPRELYYYGRELYYHARHAEAAAVFRCFLTEGKGWREDNIGACLLLSACHAALDDRENALTALFRSFLYDRPRAEVCCEIGRLYMAEERYAEAVFWYEAAAAAPPEREGFSRPDCHDYVPYMQLCVCHDRMGNLRTAWAYNEKAGRIKPKDANFLANQQYFRERL
ncbi:MAG: glycosyltransferase family 2 protein [Oscillospiraceae bacterium]|nr:glycosyltransferase family 2 protein [Oscillospiraceae bacterium]